jgi:hypothetical protein
MNRIFLALVSFMMTVALQAQNQYNIIPQPQQLTPQKGVFTLRKGANVSIWDSPSAKGRAAQVFPLT